MYQEAYEAAGSKRAAARQLGIKESTFRFRLKKELSENTILSARKGHAPGYFEHGVPDGYLMGKVTVQRSGEGGVERTWERMSPDHEAFAAMMESSIRGALGTIPSAPPIVRPTQCREKLLTLYNFFDYHVGMLAWHAEGGADWDLGIAERMGVGAMTELVAGAPASAEAVINIGGDFLHFDGLLPVTPTSGHVLDADSRFGKVVETAIRLIRSLVKLALQRHEHVTLLIMEGNHDLSSSLWLRKLFAALYEDEPRISVHQSELPYYAMEWGTNLLGFHHGHLHKNDKLPLLFASLYREQWGRCSKVHIHVGHRHHKEEKDHNGARVTQWPTLAALDAHSSRHGYFTDRELTAITYHRENGQVASNTVTPEMVGEC